MVETSRGPERFFPQKFRQPTNKFEEFFEGFYRLVQLGSTEFLLSRDSEKGVDSVHKDNLGSREKRPPYFFVCAILLTVWKKEPSLPQRLSRVVKCNKCRSVTRFRNWIFNEPGSQLPSTITRRSVFETSKEFRDVIYYLYILNNYFQYLYFFFFSVTIVRRINDIIRWYNFFSKKRKGHV